MFNIFYHYASLFVALSDTLIAILTLLSAWFWFKSTQGEVPPAPKAADAIRPEPFEKLFEVMNTQSGFNKKAAYCACFAALIMSLKLFLTVTLKL